MNTAWALVGPAGGHMDNGGWMWVWACSRTVEKLTGTILDPYSRQAERVVAESGADAESGLSREATAGGRPGWARTRCRRW